MLAWSFMFLVFAVIMGVLGYTGISSEPALIAKVLFWIFLGLFMFSFIVGLAGRRSSASRLR
jgi:uncharacterized membrane protein YtjA (UPF0391 family)